MYQYASTNQSIIEIEFVIDTGFIGFLTLPTDAVTALGLPYSHSIDANLADDSSIRVAVYTAMIVWNGEVREVEILATGRRPLIGTLLLDGYDVDLQFAEGGLVTIERL